MSSNLILIGKSGALAARGALDLTAQNIANAANESYSRRTVELGEVASKGGISLRNDATVSGVRIDRIARSDSQFLQVEARRTASDLSRANAELSSLASAENALEQSGTYPAIVEFEASLAQLASQPASAPLRSAVLESARTLASSLNIADSSLAIASEQARFEIGAGANQVTALAEELARTNTALVRTEIGSGSQAVLLDQRDALLAEMGGYAGLSVSYGKAGQAEVRLGDASGALLVSGDQSFALQISENADGTVSFAVDGESAAPASGSLAGRAQGLVMLRDTGVALDNLASQIISLTNDAQTSGVDAAGNSGQPMFSGSTARNIALALTDGSGIAAAPAGSSAGSRDGANLEILRTALANGGPAATADSLLFSVSSAVSGRTITRDALSAIAGTAQAALTAETGVDLDVEAANLLRFQQAFQASSRVIQVASDIFDTLLAIR